MVIPCNVASINYTFSGLQPATNYSMSAVVLNPGGKSVWQSITTVTGSTIQPRKHCCKKLNASSSTELIDACDYLHIIIIVIIRFSVYFILVFIGWFNLHCISNKKCQQSCPCDDHFYSRTSPIER